MGQGALNYQDTKSGIALNDLIEGFEEVYSGQSIKAGDFVNYIKQQVGEYAKYSPPDNYNISTQFYSGYRLAEPVLLDENRVLLAYGYSYIYATVVTISKDGSLQKGTEVKIGDSTSYYCSAILVRDNIVLVTYSGKGNNYLNGSVLSIIGTVITIETQNNIIVGTSYAGLVSKLVKVSDSKIALLYNSSGSSSVSLAVTTCFINDSYVPNYSTTLNIFSSKESLNSQTVALQTSENNLFILTNDSNVVKAVLVTIKGSVITKAATTTIFSKSDNYYYGASGLVLNESLVFITYSTGDTGTSPVCRLCTLTPTSIIPHTQYNIHSTTNAIGYIVPVLITDNVVGLIFGLNTASSEHTLTATEITIANTVCSYGNLTTLQDIKNKQIYAFIKGVKLANNTVFIASAFGGEIGNHHLYACLYSCDRRNKKITKEIIIDRQYEKQRITNAINPPFDAIALSNGEGVLEDAEIIDRSVLKTGNMFPEVWNEVSSLEYMSDTGVKLTSDYVVDGYPLTNAFDNDTSTSASIIGTSNEGYIQLEFPLKVKITKMKLSIFSSATSISIKVQGSLDKISWIDLYTQSSRIYPLTEINLSNVDYYKYYKLWCSISNGACLVYSFETAEYSEEYVRVISVPAEYTDQVKIAFMAGLKTVDGSYIIDKDGKLIIPEGGNE